MFLTCFSSVGAVFNNYYLNSKFDKSDLFSVDNLISSLFVFGFFTVLFNFFLPLDNNLVRYFFVIIVIFSIISFSNLILKTFKKNLLLVFLLSLICFYMEAGYDGALYHLPHQSFIKDHKIIFGLFNLHERFGTASIYSYIASIFWLGNDLIIISYLQGIFYFLLFKFLFNYLKSYNITKKSIAISSIIFLPLWIRFVQPSYGLVDLPTGIIFYLAFIKGVEIVFFNYKKDLLKIFFITSSLLLTLKSSSLIFVFYLVFIIFYVLKKNLSTYKEVFVYSLFPFLLVFFWTIKTFVNTSCIIFPLPTLCFETSWANIELTKHILNEILTYSQTYISFLSFENILELIKSKLFLFISLISLIIVILVTFTVKFLINKNVILSLIFLIILCNISIILNLEPITGFSTLTKSQVSSEKLLGKQIFFKEIFLLFFFILSSIIIIFLIYLKKLKIKNIKINNFVFFPFIFSIIFLFSWFTLSPNPRFGIGYFAVLPLSIILIFSNQFMNLIKIKEIYLTVFFFVYLISVVNISIKKNFNYNDFIIIPSKRINKIDTLKRKGFGVKPILYCESVHEGNLCWIEKNCYFIEKDAILEYLNFGYPLIKKIMDRKHPKCVKK